MLPACARYGKHLRSLGVALTLLCIAGTATGGGNGANVDVQVIVNSRAVLPHNLSSNTLRAIFTGRMRTWSDGEPIKVYVLPHTHPVHQAFCLKILKTFPYMLQRQWEQLIYTGQGTAPEEVATTYQLQAKVESTPGAIGYARRSVTHSDRVRIVGNPPANNEEADAL